MKNFKTLFLFIFFFALFLEGVNGQIDRGKSKNNNDTTSEKSKVIVFGDDEEENQNSKFKSKRYTIIKTNPFSSIFGHQVLEIERELTNVLSFQVGLGFHHQSGQNLLIYIPYQLKFELHLKEYFLHWIKGNLKLDFLPFV